MTMKEVDPSDIDRRLRRESANYGDVHVSLIWNSIDDLDLAIVTPMWNVDMCERQ